MCSSAAFWSRGGAGESRVWLRFRLHVSNLIRLQDRGPSDIIASVDYCLLLMGNSQFKLSGLLKSEQVFQVFFFRWTPLDTGGTFSGCTAILSGGNWSSELVKRLNYYHAVCTRIYIPLKQNKIETHSKRLINSPTPKINKRAKKELQNITPSTLNETVHLPTCDFIWDSSL